MEYNNEEYSLKSGVYKITNKINGRIYIGSAKEFKQRCKQHRIGLVKKSIEINSFKLTSINAAKIVLYLRLLKSLKALKKIDYW